MGCISRLILEKYDLKSCCFRSSNVCVTQECDQRPTKPIVDRKREREESRNDAIESELKKLESKMQSTLCYAYTTGQERAHNQTSREPANQAAQQHTLLTPAPTHTRAVHADARAVRGGGRQTQIHSVVQEKRQMPFRCRLPVLLHVLQRRVPLLRPHHARAAAAARLLSLAIGYRGPLSASTLRIRPHVEIRGTSRDLERPER